MKSDNNVIDPARLAEIAKPFLGKFVEGVMRAGFNPTGCFVHFFGSRLTGKTRDGGNPRPDSDLDLAIELPGAGLENMTPEDVLLSDLSELHDELKWGLYGAVGVPIHSEFCRGDRTPRMKKFLDGAVKIYEVSFPERGSAPEGGRGLVEKGNAKKKDEGKRKRNVPNPKVAKARSLSMDDAVRVLATLYRAAELEKDKVAKALLLRDATLFFAMSQFGLRVSEVVSLNVDSLRPEPGGPPDGRHGILYRFGKGSVGEKVRVVHAPTPETTGVIRRYTTDVRPELVAGSEKDGSALFVDSRGKRLSVAAATIRFRRALEATGIDRQGVTLDAIRHAFAAHTAKTRTEETTRMLTHPPPERMRRAFNRLMCDLDPAVMAASRGNRKGAVRKTKTTKRPGKA
jgi:integrase/predicted nucleotidyltransferase